MMHRPIVVFGASGHTGRFVVRELRRRGRLLVLAGRDAGALQALANGEPSDSRAVVRVASVEDPASLDAAMAGAAAVINCAGPFVDTAVPVAEAALRARVHYLDVCAEQAVTLDTFARYAACAHERGVVIAPSMGFYGALGDLLATTALGDWPAADEVHLGIALDGWQPTRGTRRTVQRNAGRHVVFTSGRFESFPDEPSEATWPFAPPFDTQQVRELATADHVTIAHHLRVPEVRAYMTLAPLRDLRDPDTPPPVAADASGRSAQTFLIEAVARRGGDERRASAAGRDIYAVTAPIVVEATERLLDGRVIGGSPIGALAAGELFHAADFLRCLSPDHLALRV
jgi:NAD(P)-dependent dehydrogenase (short-subunit alcohol dehydrogenase family)